MPDVYKHLEFEFKDMVSLGVVKNVYRIREFPGTIIAWTDCDAADVFIDIKFDSSDDAIMFALKWS